MRRGTGIEFAPVTGSSNYLPATNDDSANRHFSQISGKTGLLKGHLHESDIFSLG